MFHNRATIRITRAACMRTTISASSPTAPIPEPGTSRIAIRPAAYWHETDNATHNSQELRVSTPDDWRLRGIGGFFWEDYTVAENIDWHYKSLPPCRRPRTPVA